MARKWLGIEANLGLAPNTIDAYGRALLRITSLSAPVHPSKSRTPTASTLPPTFTIWLRGGIPSHRMSSSIPLLGWRNVTLQQRLTAIRLFYDYLIEEGRRVSNPVVRGR